MNNPSLLILGSGASLGVPVVGCSCEVCKSSNTKNKRLRPSALLKIAGKQILIDCGPDVRQQLLRAEVKKIDGIILTHAHYDHVEGVDEMRAFSIIDKRSTPFLMSEETLEDLKRRFAYIFEHQQNDVIITARMSIDLFKSKRGHTHFCGIPIQYCTFSQMGMSIQGLRIGNLAYISDIKEYPDTIFDDLKGVETLVLSALRHTESKMHLSVDEAVAFFKRTGAKQCWLTHISHDLDHEKTNQYLPENVRLAYDDLLIDFSYG